MSVKQKDDWNAFLYDGKHSFVSKYGSSLVELLAPKKGEKVLDVGCGTGDLASEIERRGAVVLGIDLSENMIAKAKEKYPHIEFLVKDITNFDINEAFDAVFSNATLHWVKEQENALANIYRCLKKGGRFVAEFGGKGNVQRITDEILKEIHNGVGERRRAFPWYYPSIGEYSFLMERAGFRVTFAMHFDRPTPLEGEEGLRNWIEMFGSQLFDGIEEEQKEKIIVNVEHSLKPFLYENGVWLADYKRIRVFGIKE